jgi:hypothetical protein
MQKVAIVILADTTPADGLGRIVNALMAAKEFKEARADVQLIFTGAGTKWIGELADPKHQLHEVFNTVKDRIAGACGFCASAFGQTAAVKDGRIRILEEFGTNMSFQKLVDNGYHVITF